MRPDLRAFLQESGASEGDIARAETEGWLPLLALDRLLMPGVARYDLQGLAAANGVDVALLQRLWRALGFPDVPLDAALFNDIDAAATQRLLHWAATDGRNGATIIRQVQVSSASMARMAAVEADAIADLLQQLRAAGLSPDDVAMTLLDTARWDDLAALIDYNHRLQLRAAVWRRLALDAAPDIALGIGFADLAGYTKATEHLDADAIEELIARWEGMAYDTVTAHGGRIVKTIGDEVMFVGLPSEVADAALSLRDQAASDPALLPVRVGVAAGPVVRRSGDYYGPIVNLASRLSELAPAGRVIASTELGAQLDPASYRLVSLGVRRLRSIGDVEVCALERADGERADGERAGR